MAASVTPSTPRVFISHSSEDLALVARLAHDLDARLGDPEAVWYDAQGLRGADQWWPVIQQELTDRPIFLIVLTPAAVGSKWVRDELAIAWNQRNSPAGKLVLPVLLKPCAVPEDLKTLQTPDFATKPYAAMLDEVEATIRAGRERRAALDARLAGRAQPTALPRAASLVGRETELATLLAELQRGETVVSVFAVEGLAGVGKTALAAEAVARLAADVDTFPGGAAWVSCEGKAGDAVAALPDAERRRGALRAALDDPARSRVLLALDNVEPGLDADALLDTLAGGRATLLLTARGAVAVQRVQALPLPPLQEAPAETLFAQRLRQADPTRPTPEEQPQIPPIILWLGGLPLGIELAAAYAGRQREALTDLLADLATQGTSAVPLVRLQARIDRSWSALSGALRHLFAGLSLLEGASFPREAAEALAGAVPGDPEGAQGPRIPVERVDALVDLALVEPLANRRLRLHPVLRDYAGMRLGALVATEPEVVVRLYRRAVDIEPNDDVTRIKLALLLYHIGRPTEALGEVRRAAAQRPGDSHVHVLLADMLVTLDRLDEAEAAYRAVLQLDPSSVDALVGLANLLDTRSLTAEAEPLYRRAIASDPQAWEAHFHYAILLAGAQQPVEAEREYRCAIELADSPEAMVGYGRFLARHERWDEALTQYRRALDLRPDDVDTWRGLAVALAALNDREAARAAFDRALAVAEQTHEALTIARVLNSLGRLAIDEGNVPEACRCFREALDFFERLGSPEAEEPRAQLRELECDTDGDG